MLALVAVLALAGLAGWRLLRRPAVPATPEMRAAMTELASAASTTSAKPTAAGQAHTARGRLIVAALSLQGIPYRWAAKGPDHYDCSGFTKAAYAKIGAALPDGSFNQAKGERPLTSPDLLAPGDLIFYRWPGHRDVQHVTMYAGDGWVIGTGTPGEPSEVALYPLAHDITRDGTVLTYRHVRLPDER